MGSPSSRVNCRSVAILLTACRVVVSASSLHVTISSVFPPLPSAAEFGVRLRMDRDAKTVQVRGPQGGLLAVRAAIKAAEATKREIVVDSRVLPSVLGKGGANFKKLREDVSNAHQACL